MLSSKRHAGLTMVEIVIVVAVIGILAAITGPLLQNMRDSFRVKQAARDLSDLLMVARAEAIRSGTNHIVFFWFDAQGNALTDPAGNRAVAVLIADNDVDGLIDAGEVVQWVLVDPNSAVVNWGVGAAGVSVPTDPDPNGTFATGWTFRDTAAPPNATQWVVFNPDGIPRGFSIGPFDDGGAAGIGTGAGGAYVTDGQRDYAVVLSALGTVRVHNFNPGANQWRN